MDAKPIVIIDDSSTFVDESSQNNLTEMVTPTETDTAADIDTSNEHECSICLDRSLLEQIKQLPCSHKFHEACIDSWLNTNRSCPICRIVIIVDNSNMPSGSRNSYMQNINFPNTDEHHENVVEVQPHDLKMLLLAYQELQEIIEEARNVSHHGYTQNMSQHAENIHQHGHIHAENVLQHTENERQHAHGHELSMRHYAQCISEHVGNVSQHAENVSIQAEIVSQHPDNVNQHPDNVNQHMEDVLHHANNIHRHERRHEENVGQHTENLRQYAHGHATSMRQHIDNALQNTEIGLQNLENIHQAENMRQQTQEQLRHMQRNFSNLH